MSLSSAALHPFASPRSLDEALGILAERAACGARSVPLAGGTDWYVEQHAARTPAPDADLPLLVDVSRLPELRGITLAEGALRIGAGTTYLALRRDPLVTARVPLLAAMAKDVGAFQIQARGTLAGNLASASPAADGVCALAALDAELTLASVRGARTVALRDFTIGYRRTVLAADELIVAIGIPLPAPGAAWAWRKVGTRQAQAISKVAFAGLAELSGGKVVRLGFGMASVAPTVAFLPRLRELGLGRAPSTVTDDEIVAALLADISPIDDIRSTAAYRRHVARALVTGFFRDLARTPG